MTLTQLKKNQSAFITGLPSSMTVASRLMEHGFFVDAEVKLAHKAPFNGPLAFYLHGTKVSLQPSLAEQINVEVKL